jgi:hypothetical protein
MQNSQLPDVYVFHFAEVTFAIQMTIDLLDTTQSLKSTCREEDQKIDLKT